MITSKPGATVVDVGMNKLTEPEEVRSMFGPAADKRMEVLAKRGYTLVGDVKPVDAMEVAEDLRRCLEALDYLRWQC